MPELPEVQTAIDDLLSAGLPGRRILEARVNRPGTVKPLGPDQFSRMVRGLVFRGIRRRGKYIIFTMSRDLSILAHLRMTGQFKLSSAADGTDPHDRVVFSLEDRRALRFHDTRAFGRLLCTPRPGDILDRLGPDALDPAITPVQFTHMLHSRRRQIKALLLDQVFIAGLGNIYCDEGLYRAGIHPLRRSDTLGSGEAILLFQAIRSVLATALRNRGTSLGTGETNYMSGGKRGENRSSLQVYGRENQQCLRCGSIIKKIYVGQRGTHYCPVCQPDQRK